MSRIYLIRHGKTEANLRHLYCGSTDLPLSEEGIRELRQLCYSHPEADFITSGMKRTEQTLEILFGKRDHSCDPEFREIDFGVFEMQSYEQLKDRAEYQRWISGDNDRNPAPGGESGIQMQQRALRAFRGVEARNRDTVIITHGGVIAAIMEQLFPDAHKNRYQWQPAPGYGYALDGSGWRPIP